MSDIKSLRRRVSTSITAEDVRPLWSARTIGSRRRGDITEPVSDRLVAVWSTARLSALR